MKFDWFFYYSRLSLHILLVVKKTTIYIYIYTKEIYNPYQIYICPQRNSQHGKNISDPLDLVGHFFILTTF